MRTVDTKVLAHQPTRGDPAQTRAAEAVSVIGTVYATGRPGRLAAHPA